MGAASSSSGGGGVSKGKSESTGAVDPEDAQNAAPKLQLKLEDLELPPRRDRLPGAPSSAQAPSSGEHMFSPVAPLTGGSTTSRVGATSSITEEIFRGGEPLGQKAFQADGLVGTESQQLSLLAHYAELCEDFRRYQRQTRAEGAPLEAAKDGAQMLLLSGAPGTGKTQHAVSFARALGLPLLIASPVVGTAAGLRTSGWSAQLRREVNGRDCILFFDEIDQHAGDDAFASELRQFLDGVCQPSESRVLLVGTTNRIDRLPEDVLHRAEVILFERPQEVHLSQMWSGFAQHLRGPELAQLSSVSVQGGITGRDVRHCASWAERHTAISFLNASSAQGYCHGAALSNCPLPSLDLYLRCVRGRSAGKGALQWPGAGMLAAAGVRSE